MALVLADRVKDTTTTTGTGTITLSGTAPTGYVSFGTAVGNGNTTYYTITAGSEWEVGIGTYTAAGTTLSRTTVLASSNAGSLVTFSAGTKDVFVTYPAGKAIYEDGSDNVGIGTATPGERLTVAGNIQASNASYGFLGITSGTVQGQFAANGGGASLDIRAVSNHPMTFFTNNTECMRILSGGNVGIGTNGPNYKLETNGVIASYLPSAGQSGYWIYNGGATAEWFTGQRSGTDHAYKISQVAASVYTDRVTVDTTGQVGIGTNSPGALLQLNKATGAADLRLSVGGTLYTNIYASSSDVNILSVTAIPLIFGTNNSESMRILSGGNVGIGTNTPATKLEVNGGLIAGAENRQTHPPTGPVGFKAQWNFSGGDGETDLYNLHSTATTSFRFYQTTGSGTAQLLYNMRPSDHEFYTGGTLRFAITSSGAITSSALADAVGYKGLPQNSQTASYTLALTDMGKHISITTGGVVIPANGSVAFPIGSAISIFNNSGSNQTISITTDTLRLAGTATTGSRTLAQYGVATCLKVTSTVWVISGAGVT